jgi:hypothetical protein
MSRYVNGGGMLMYMDIRVSARSDLLTMRGVGDSGSSHRLARRAIPVNYRLCCVSVAVCPGYIALHLNSSELPFLGSIEFDDPVVPGPLLPTSLGPCF